MISIDKSGLVVVKAADDRVEEVVRFLLENTPSRISEIDDRSSVCIKPNVCIMKKSNTGATTDPRVVSAIIDFIRSRCNCRISIVESDATVNNLDAAYAALGWKRLAKAKSVDLVNLSKVPNVSVSVDGYHLKRIRVPEIVLQSDLLVSVPKLKIHEMTGITGALKNQFGLLPIRRKSTFHSHISEVIADVNRVLRPHVVVTDALVVLKGGAISGIPLRTNFLVSSSDPVANDSFCARYAGLRPRSVKHIALSEAAGIGTTKFIVRGDISTLKPQNLAAQSNIDRFTFSLLSLVKGG